MRHLLFALMALLIFSCNKNKDNAAVYTQWPLVKVEGPTNGSQNVTIPIIVFWPYASGCDVLDRFEESKQANVIFIKSFGHSNEGICTMDAGVKTKTYNFTPTTKGNYELRFLNSDGSYISHELTIN